MRDIETIDSKLRVLLAIRNMVREEKAARQQITPVARESLPRKSSRRDVATHDPAAGSCAAAGTAIRP